MALFLALSVGCNSAEKKKEKEQAENQKVETRAKELAQQMAGDMEARRKADEAAAKAKADQAERDKLAQSPQDLFEASGLKLLPTGRGHLQGVSEVTLTNKSHHLVTGLRARIDFMKDGDVEVALPLQLTGSLPAGATRTFSTADQTLTAGAVEATGSETRVIVTSAHPDQESAGTGQSATPPTAGAPNAQQ